MDNSRFSPYSRSTTTVTMQATSEPKRSSMRVFQQPQITCCLLFTAVFLLLSSLSLLGGAGFVASKSRTLTYHYPYFICGVLSLLTSAISFYASRDVSRSRGGLVVTSAFAIAGIIACIVAIPFATSAINNEDNDCALPSCKIDRKFEISAERVDFGGISCAWQCFENYTVFWQVMMSVAIGCAGLQAVIAVVIIYHCLVGY